MIGPDDLDGLKELADECDREAIKLAQTERRGFALVHFQLAAMLRDYAERNG